jgi:hypothetical protein
MGCGVGRTTRVAFVDCLVLAERTVDRHVWLDAAAELVALYPPGVRIALASPSAQLAGSTPASSSSPTIALTLSVPSYAGSGR